MTDFSSSDFWLLTSNWERSREDSEITRSLDRINTLFFLLAFDLSWVLHGLARSWSWINEWLTGWLTGWRSRSWSDLTDWLIDYDYNDGMIAISLFLGRWWVMRSSSSTSYKPQAFFCASIQSYFSSIHSFIHSSWLSICLVVNLSFDLSVALKMYNIA